MNYTNMVGQVLVCVYFKAFQIAYSLTITGSGNYIIPNTGYELTCSYDTFKDDRQTVYNVYDNKSGGIESFTIRYFNSTGQCFYRNPDYVPCVNDVCSCDQDGMATHICYNHTSNITGTIAVNCFSGNNSITRIPVAVGPGDSMDFKPPSTHDIKTLGESLGPITCSASCYPECQYEWTMQSGTILRGSTLNILSLTKDDNGIYSCKAWNDVYASGKTMEFNLTVNYGPESVSLLPLDTKYTLTEGNDIPSISCMADCKPACGYTWSGPNVPAGTDNVLKLQNIHKNQRGVFNCAASNYVGSFNSTDVKIDVQFGPGSSMQFKPSITGVTKKKGDKLGPISCAATCNPPCQYKWTKPDKTVIADAQLMLASLSFEDHGQFTCTASNDIGSSVNKRLDVIVNYGPMAVILLPSTQQYTVEHGETIPPINCSANCRPDCKNMWSGPIVASDVFNVLSLHTIQKNQSGDYRCLASNEVGNMQSSIINVDVQFGPGSSLQFYPSNTSVTKKKGDKLGPIDCRATCNPPCQYKWTKPDKTIINDRELTIVLLSTHDHGTFVCIASNRLGDSQKNLHVTVEFKPFLDTTRSNSPEKIVSSENDYLFITVSVKSNPHPIIKWTFITQDNIEFCNNSAINSNSIHDGLHSSSNISINNLKKNQFGQYTFMATNVVGIFRRNFSVLEKGEPIPPSYVYVVCKSTTAIIVILKPILNGNLQHELYIQYTVKGQDMTSVKVNINDTNQHIEYTVTGLNPGRKYNFSVLAVNLFGETTSNQVECLTDTLSFGQDMLALKEDNSGMFSAGIAVLVVGLLFIVAATILIFRKRFKKSFTKSSKSDEYSDLQTSNPAFQDPYTSLQNPIESRHQQQPSTNTYEECGNASDAAAYQNIENMKSGHKKAEKNMDIYDDVKI